MAKNLLKNNAAEKEANDVAFRFMNSSDVVGDMRRAYSGRLDRVRLHDDAAADARVSAAGRDGIASGEDIYLKKGMLSDHAPEAKGLIAHEMTHVLQQTGGGESKGTSESVSYGEEQGGIKDWFKGLFGKKKMEISEPELVSHKSYTAGDLGNTAEIKSPEDLAFAMQFSDTKKSLAGTERTRENYGQDIYTFNPQRVAGATYGAYEMQGLDSLALAKVIESGNPDVFKSKLAQKRVMDDFNTSAQRVLTSDSLQSGTLEKNREQFRSGQIGASYSLNEMVRHMIPEGYVESFKDMGYKDSLSKVAQDLGEGGSLSEVSDYLGGSRAAFTGSKFFDTDEEASAMMMNNFMLRQLLPDMAKTGFKDKGYKRNFGADQMQAPYIPVTGQEAPDEDVRNPLVSQMMMKDLKDEYNSDAKRKVNPIMQALTGIFGKRRRTAGAR